MQIEALGIFCDVVRHQSFSRAALANSVSQSSASQTVRHIERRIGAQLIDRSHRPWRLTTEGELFFKGCQEIVDRYRELEESVQKQKRAVHTIRVASIYSVGMHDLSLYVDRFRAAEPGAHVDIDYMHPDEIPACIRSDQYELGLLAFGTPGRDLTVVPWQEQVMVVACPPSHRFAKQASAISPRELGARRSSRSIGGCRCAASSTATSGGTRRMSMSSPSSTTSRTSNRQWRMAPGLRSCRSRPSDARWSCARWSPFGSRRWTANRRSSARSASSIAVAGGSTPR